MSKTMTANNALGDVSLRLYQVARGYHHTSVGGVQCESKKVKETTNRRLISRQKVSLGDKGRFGLLLFSGTLRAQA